MKFYNSIISYIIKRRNHQIDFFKKYPLEVQKDLFHELIYKAKNTVWGKEHQYAKIKSIADFKNQVPIQNYDSLKPYIEKVRAGEQNILWHSEVKWFAQSSGTTAGKSKFIPVSKESLEQCHFKGGKDLMSIFLNHYPETNILDGKSMVLGGSSNISSYRAKSFYGDLSAVIIENLPFWFNLVKTPSKEIALHPNWEEKIDKMAQIVSKENVSSLSGVPSWNLILLQKVLEITGKENILEVWPNLELFIHGGVKFEPYKKQYEKLIPSLDMKYMETYNASEGFFGIQDQTNSKEMLLMLDYGVFYEFLPLEELGKENPKTVQLEEVEINTNYAIIISTNAGLWRYMIGDTIKFTSLKPFRIVLSGRTKYFINIFGEELIEENANNALKTACDKTNAISNEYMVAPIFPNENGKGGHEWLIEFQKKPKDLVLFTKILDEALQAENSDYEAKRFQNMALQLPKINIAEPDTFYKWLKTKGKIGGQHKVPKLSDKRIYLEEILSI
ncbi:MAG: GH3 auxin-responsive promoter family protein [Chitinophagales bacterium]